MFTALLVFLGVLSASALSPSTAPDFWVTTAITEFRVRDECSTFWNSSSACSSPLIRISTDVNTPSQFATRFWPIASILSSPDRPAFITQWHGSVESVRVFAQIEGSNKLNPFGRVPKCDEGFHPKIVFNQSSLDIMERRSTRIIVIESHCFSVKVLVKIDTECPYCPTTTTTKATTTTVASPLVSQEDVLLLAIIVLLFVFLVLLIVFSIVLTRYLNKRSSFKTCPSLESGISSVPTESTAFSLPYQDMFSILPPLIDYDEDKLEETFRSIDINDLPRLGSLTYDMYVSVSEPITV